MKYLILLTILCAFAQAKAEYVAPIYGWHAVCGPRNNSITITPSDDDARIVVTNNGKVVTDELASVDTYQANAKRIRFTVENGSSIVLTRDNINGVGTGKAVVYIKKPAGRYEFSCRIGYIPSEDGPDCFSAASLKNKACQL